MKCDLCGSSDRLKGELTQKCSKCGLVTATEEHFAIPYSTIYTENYYQNGDYEDYEKEENALRKNFKNRLSRIVKYIRTGSLLEVGSAFGYFLDEASNNFTVSGVECFPDLAEKVEQRLNVPVFKGPFEEQNFTPRSYDVVVALDTVEHLHTPSAFFQMCNFALKDKGFLFLETGDVSAFVPSVRKEKWRLVHPPEHLHYFSVSTLSAYLTKYGFEVLKVERVPFYRSFAQIAFRVSPVLWNKLARNESFKNLLSKLCLSINTFDLVFITARKV